MLFILLPAVLFLQTQLPTACAQFTTHFTEEPFKVLRSTRSFEIKFIYSNVVATITRVPVSWDKRAESNASTRSSAVSNRGCSRSRMKALTQCSEPESVGLEGRSELCVEVHEASVKPIRKIVITILNYITGLFIC